MALDQVWKLENRTCPSNRPRTGWTFLVVSVCVDSPLSTNGSEKRSQPNWSANSLVPYRLHLSRDCNPQRHPGALATQSRCAQLSVRLLPLLWERGARLCPCPLPASTPQPLRGASPPAFKVGWKRALNCQTDAPGPERGSLSGHHPPSGILPGPRALLLPALKGEVVSAEITPRRQPCKETPRPKLRMFARSGRDQSLKTGKSHSPWVPRACAALVTSHGVEGWRRQCRAFFFSRSQGKSERSPELSGENLPKDVRRNSAGGVVLPGLILRTGFCVHLPRFCLWPTTAVVSFNSLWVRPILFDFSDTLQETKSCS